MRVVSDGKSTTATLMPSRGDSTVIVGWMKHHGLAAAQLRAARDRLRELQGRTLGQLSPADRGRIVADIHRLTRLIRGQVTSPEGR